MLSETERVSEDAQVGFLLPASFSPITLPGPDNRSFVAVGDAEPGEYEKWLMTSRPRSEVAWLLSRLLGNRGTLLDIGANIGTVALPLALSGTRVVAVEPLPRNCLKLHLARLLNHASSLEIFQMAASNTDCILHFGGAEAWGRIGGGETEIAAVRLDTLCDALRVADPGFPCAPLVIKIDVEGHELSVLEGAVNLIERHRPPILFESIEIEGRSPEQHSKRCKHFLESLGYRLFVQRGEVLTARRAEQVQEGHVGDVLAVPSERPEILRDLEIRDLTPEERVAWIREMAEVPFLHHRLHAAGVVVTLSREEPALVPFLAPLAELLAADKEPEVAAILRAT